MHPLWVVPVTHSGLVLWYSKCLAARNDTQDKWTSHGIIKRISDFHFSFWVDIQDRTMTTTSPSYLALRKQRSSVDELSKVWEATKWKRNFRWKYSRIQILRSELLLQTFSYENFCNKTKFCQLGIGYYVHCQQQGFWESLGTTTEEASFTR